MFFFLCQLVRDLLLLLPDGDWNSWQVYIRRTELTEINIERAFNTDKLWFSCLMSRIMEFMKKILEINTTVTRADNLFKLKYLRADILGRISILSEKTGLEAIFFIIAL